MLAFRPASLFLEAGCRSRSIFFHQLSTLEDLLFDKRMLEEFELVFGLLLVYYELGTELVLEEEQEKYQHNISHVSILFVLQ